MAGPKIANILRTVVSQPLVHFLVVGAGLFALYTFMSPAQNMSQNTIVIDNQTVSTIIRKFGSAWGRAPSSKEMKGLLDSYIEEELYYREGLALGLDDNDQVIRRRMRQKMSVIAEEDNTEAAAFPTLEDWFANHRANYQTLDKFSFQQIFFGNDDNPQKVENRIASAKKSLQSGADPITLGDQTLLPFQVDGQPIDLVAREFGSQFSRDVSKLTIGQWSGPIASGLGLHLVNLSHIERGRLLELDDVRWQVEQDYESARRKDNARHFYGKLLQDYQIKITADLPDEAYPEQSLR